MKPRCCACGGDGMQPPGDWASRHREAVRGLVELAPKKHICAACTRRAAALWAQHSLGGKLEVARAASKLARKPSRTKRRPTPG